MIAITAPSPSPPGSQVSHEHLTVSGMTNGDEEAASLSRNTSVISTTSSSSASSSSSSIAPPQRPRPIRTYTGPQAKNVPDVLPASPTTPKAVQRNFEDYIGSAGASSRTSPTPGVSAQMAAAIARGINGLAVPGLLLNGQSSSGTSTPNSRVQTPGTGTSTPNGVRTRQASASNSPQNYRFDGVLGEGSYSTVFVATSLVNQQIYAVKVISKRLLQKENKVRYATSERAILSKLGSATPSHPGIIKLYSAFQDANSLYFAFELAPNGELFSQIRRLGSFDIIGTQYYAATILDAVAFIHSMNIIHRDLKPENILLDANMKIKISDFGSAKDKSIAVVITSDSRGAKGSFVGTPEYASPEMLVPPTITTRASDIWAYGCVVFQMIAGRPPFKEGTDYLTMKKIQEGTYSFPEGFDPVVRTLVAGCLVVDPTVRITSGALKEHAFFESIDWENIWNETPPTLASGLVKPPERNDEDVNLHLNLTWTMDGSEDEMEDLRPAPNYRHQHEPAGSIPMPSTAEEREDESVQEASPTDRRNSLETTPTRARDENQRPFMISTPADLMTQLRRFSIDNKLGRRASIPFDDSAVVFSPTDEVPNKPRRFSANSDMNPRPRRISPSSTDGKPAKPRPHSEGLQEAEEEASSEQWSAESPPSTTENLEPSLDTIEESMSGLGISDGSGLAKSESMQSSGDAGFMSTSGTSKGSTTSGGDESRGGKTRGFERVRGAKGMDLGESPATMISGEGWKLPNSISLLGATETASFITPVTTRLKRGLLPPKQRRRMLMLTSTGRLLCFKELKSTSGKKKAQLEDEILMRAPSSPSSLSPPTTSSGGIDIAKPTTSLDAAVPSAPVSGSPSKRSSIIGLTFGSGSSITSAIPNLTLSLPGSSKTPSNSSFGVGSPPSGNSVGAGSSTSPASRLIAIATKVEGKGESGFTVYFGDRSLVFGVDSASTAMKWQGTLKEAMETR